MFVPPGTARGQRWEVLPSRGASSSQLLCHWWQQCASKQISRTLEVTGKHSHSILGVSRQGERHCHIGAMSAGGRNVRTQRGAWGGRGSHRPTQPLASLFWKLTITVNIVTWCL